MEALYQPLHSVLYQSHKVELHTERAGQVQQVDANLVLDLR